MAAGTLYTYQGNFRAYKILVAAQYSGADVKVADGFKLGETNKTSDFLSKFPLGKVPAFQSKDGLSLSESNAIAYYVGNPQLRGSSPEAASQVQQWTCFADNEILPAACTWVFPCLGIIQYNKQDTERAKEQIRTALDVLNKVLLTRTYLVGERISQADISVACNLIQLYQYVLDPDFRKSYPNVNRWFTTLINQKEFKTVIKNFALCTKMAQFDAKKYAELHGGQKEGKKDSKKESKKEAKPAQKPKEEKPAEAEEAPRPEKKDPFAQFPKGNFDFDEFKRTYSNEDTEKVALPYFWDKFEKDNYSIWYCEYTQDLSSKMTFMVCNLVSGMFQRLDKMRKNSFGSQIIFGSDKKNSISGIWFWRGPQLAFELSEDWQIDYESYKWTKLDPNDAKTKTLVKEYFTWEGNFDGKEFNQGKIFK
ncbi:elongation factor 1-gamma-like [Haliotis rubra]|uniref:elongation factor 1-gamma-like n=1 Tax=Haliotis rubra TaxID=36100 RepID=UPI001EE5D8B4|nr:elongation factor 1-gamma-like [Haliotis rubra]